MTPREIIIATLGGKVSFGEWTSSVQEFARAKSRWKAQPALLQKTYGSSAAVFNNVLYDIGGHESSHSLEWLDLTRTEVNWAFMKT